MKSKSILIWSMGLIIALAMISCQPKDRKNSHKSRYHVFSSPNQKEEQIAKNDNKYKIHSNQRERARQNQQSQQRVRIPEKSEKEQKREYYGDGVCQLEDNQKQVQATMDEAPQERIQPTTDGAIQNKESRKRQYCKPKQRSEFDQGYIIPDGYCPQGYNQSGRIDPTGSVDFIMNGKFIYWKTEEDHLVLAEDNTTNGNVSDRKTIGFNFDYDPGFKVLLGVGFNPDDWQLRLEYTRIHSSASKSYTTDTGHNLLQHWYITSVADINQLSGKWKLDYDLLTLMLEKPYYVGQRIVLNPGLGLIGGWLDQNLGVTYTSPTRTRVANVKSNSWLIGPRVGLDSNWLLGQGWRFLANGGFSLFYQKATSNTGKFTNAVSDSADNNITEKNLKNDDVSYMRPEVDLLVGLGWGKYFCNKKFHFDVYAGYESQFFWSQNMMRNLVSRNINSNIYVTGIETHGQLMLHGLTVSARFDF